MVRLSQPQNIPLMSTTFDVSRAERSISSRLSQSLNMYFMSLAREASRTERSISFSELQPLNIEDRSSALAVAKPVRSMVSSEEQPPNISAMSPTFDMSRRERSHEVMFAHSENHPLVDVGAIPSSTTSTASMSWSYPSHSQGALRPSSRRRPASAPQSTSETIRPSKTSPAWGNAGRW